MVGCNGYRNPALLAKITSTIDVISGGRLDWGIGAGWYEHEFKGYGYEFPPPKVRIGHAARGRRDREGDVDRARRHLRGHALPAAPARSATPSRCSSRTRRSWIGGGGEQLTLRVVARHATHSNFGGKPDEWAHKAEVLKGHCEAVGRDYDEITKTWSPEVFIRETEAEVDGGRVALVLGRAGRVVDGGQPRRHARAGGREDPGLRRPRLHRLRPVVQRLPRHRDDAPPRREGHPASSA